MNVIIIGLISLVGLAILTVVLAVSWFRVVPSSEAHLVITPNKRMVCSSDTNFARNAGASYYAIPTSIPFFGRIIRPINVTIQELVLEQETYEKDQARYKVSSSTKYRIIDVEKAAESFTDMSDLQNQLKEIVQSSVRSVTVKYDVNEARSNKEKMSDEIEKVITTDLGNWGIKLINFVLVDFKDTAESKIITNISQRREVEIASSTRQLNAERIKLARMKEAEADELSQKREIERDRVVGQQKQEKDKLIADKEKEAKESYYKVKQVEIVKQAEITKEAAIVKAYQDKETEKIIKETKQLEGEGDKLRAEQRAKGDAAPIREKGFAEAEAKMKLQEALNKFEDKAIRALVAEKIVEAQRDIGIAGAKALEKAEMKVFAGSDSGGGFDIGKVISQTSVANSSTADAILNKLARSNDLGFSDLNVKEVVKTKNK